MPGPPLGRSEGPTEASSRPWCPFMQTLPPSRKSHLFCPKTAPKWSGSGQQSPSTVSCGFCGSGIQAGTVGTVALCSTTPGASAGSSKAGGGITTSSIPPAPHLRSRLVSSGGLRGCEPESQGALPGSLGFLTSWRAGSQGQAKSESHVEATLPFLSRARESLSRTFGGDLHGLPELSAGAGGQGGRPLEETTSPSPQGQGAQLALPPGNAVFPSVPD